MRVSLHATENAKPQYIKVRPPEDHPFLKFQAVDLRFDLTIRAIFSNPRTYEQLKGFCEEQKLGATLSELPPTLPVTPSLPPTQPAATTTSVGTVISNYRGHTGKITSVAWSPDSKHIVSSGEDKTLEIWDAATARTVATCGGHSRRVNAVAWSLDGRYIASGGDDIAISL